ncbi:hypothetical protein V8C86DRAFT_3022845 [Haematococcus lacustris]
MTPRRSTRATAQQSARLGRARRLVWRAALAAEHQPQAGQAAANGVRSKVKPGQGQHSQGRGAASPAKAGSHLLATAAGGPGPQAAAATAELSLGLKAAADAAPSGRPEPGPVCPRAGASGPALPATPLGAAAQELRRRLEERRRLVEGLEAALAEKDSQAMKAAAQHAQELQQAVDRAMRAEAQASQLSSQLASEQLARTQLADNLAALKAQVDHEHAELERVKSEAWGLRAEVSQLQADLAASHAREAVARQRQEELETAARASAVAAATAEEQARMARNAFDLELLSRAAAQRSADEANVQAQAIAAELAELRVEMQALRAQVARSSLGDKELRAELEQAEDAAALRADQLAVREAFAQAAQDAAHHMCEQLLLEAPPLLLEAADLMTSCRLLLWHGSAALEATMPPVLQGMAAQAAQAQAVMAAFLQGPVAQLCSRDLLQPGPFLSDTQACLLPLTYRPAAAAAAAHPGALDGPPGVMPGAAMPPSPQRWQARLRSPGGSPLSAPHAPRACKRMRAHASWGQGLGPRPPWQLQHFTEPGCDLADSVLPAPRAIPSHPPPPPTHCHGGPGPAAGQWARLVAPAHSCTPQLPQGPLLDSATAMQLDDPSHVQTFNAATMQLNSHATQPQASLMAGGGPPTHGAQALEHRMRSTPAAAASAELQPCTLATVVADEVPPRAQGCGCPAPSRPPMPSSWGPRLALPLTSVCQEGALWRPGRVRVLSWQQQVEGGAVGLLVLPSALVLVLVRMSAPVLGVMQLGQGGNTRGPSLGQRLQQQQEQGRWHMQWRVDQLLWQQWQPPKRQGRGQQKLS